MQNLEIPFGLIDDVRAGYAPNVIWNAPRRGLLWMGREKVIANLLREAAAMQGKQFNRLRRHKGDAQIIDEYVARFTYRGEGIENVALPAGASVELQRLRILVLANNLVTRETVIETWTVLD